ncbi:MAG TPA: SUMF1/EgtB/PvdO family nonheme iron enzyme [Candidatus Competibacter sp.]|nr:SUMF1/EgtB/PvdO family nonheme iron enzyme [Candidatus Competibacter sp.]
MDAEIRHDFKALLLAQPFWDETRDRRAFLRDLFAGHPLYDGLILEGKPATVASDLVDLCDRHAAYPMGGRTPCRALLHAIRQAGATAGELGNALDRLEQALRPTHDEAPKPKWYGEPYPGLDYFDHTQAPIFFGRETETQQLIERLQTQRGQRLLIVTGASGSGKSSLVRAGLWARLEQGQCPEIPGSREWLITAMMPTEWGDDPLCSLVGSLKKEAFPDLHWLKPGPEYQQIKANPDTFPALVERVLARRPPVAEWLLILDQMEELFTPAVGDRGDAFLDFLLEAVKQPRFRVVATVRADFLDRCVAHSGLRGVLNRQGQYSVAAPNRLTLERMVEAPVTDVELWERLATGEERRIDLSIDGALVRQVAADASGEPGGLALLAFALQELYLRCRERGRLDLATYEKAGGLAGAIARRADAALREAGPEAEASLPRVFSPLVYVREEDGAATRRRARETTWQADVVALRIIEAFTQARLLVRGRTEQSERQVEVAHEALLREWPLLRDWIADRREALRLRDRIVTEANAWVEQGQPAFLLWKHERLAPARALLEEADLLGHLEQDSQVADFLKPEVDWLLAALADGGADHTRREDIGRRLAEIGDPRPGVGVKNGLPDLLWRLIPAGKVKIGMHGHFKVAPFHMAAYPVTYAQYQIFLEAEDGYASAAWWDGLQHEPEPGSQLRRYANYPADNISWYDANAFCRWLSVRLGFEIRLPDEWEWRWAAQSARADFAYPWGLEWREGVANTVQAGIGRTTAVGMYPEGRSLQGVYDLVGNIWEWCRNSDDYLYQKTPMQNDRRVVRGGSWSFNRAYARVDGRFVDPPRDRSNGFGFRVVCAAPILR